MRDRAGARGDAPGALKYDADKPRWDLLPYDAIGAIVEVMTFGARKYAPDGWRAVPDGRARYFAALMRHLVAWRAGATHDPDSGLHHLAHAACDAVFLLWIECFAPRVKP